jgi:putative ABC transport system permease protein
VLDKVYYQHAVDWLGQQFYVIQVIILIIVTLGIGNTISFTILERKREIGNLRANGESSWEVLRLLVFEGIYLGLLGASVGAGLAWLLDITLFQQGILMPPAPGITRQYYVKLDLDLQMTFIAIVLGFATSIVATVVAGQKVVRIPIGEALRSH